MSRWRLLCDLSAWSSTRKQRSKSEGKMPLFNVVIGLIVVGVLLWLVNRFIPMDRKIKSILNVVVVIAVVLWLLNAFGLFNTNIRIGN
ncbi:MAG: Thivi_2564 family membrane protein [Rhodothermales bacterium]